jgi:5-deoxy-glucuronate isomerase
MSVYSSQLEIKNGVGRAELPEGMFNYINGFCVRDLDSKDTLVISTSPVEEIGILILSGACDIVLEGKIYNGVGARESVFDGVPAGVYIPPGMSCSITGKRARLAICRGKCGKKTHHAVIRPEDVKVMKAGKDNWQRDVRIIIGPDGPSENLILGETINPAGNWSGTPPHKHEVYDLPRESMHEELYYFKSDKPQGYGAEKFYSPERGVDELIPLRDNTVTYMPWGYHQIVAGPGYTLYYLFFLSGKGKQLAGAVDPDHEWITK